MGIAAESFERREEDLLESLFKTLAREWHLGAQFPHITWSEKPQLEEHKSLLNGLLPAQPSK